ncbi:hypothetical protein QAD02_007175 [Eretmocerus hayati]|uniref:Uncharacterized protein n=1 Tax=Eretmocerus hayati TaxID=131215 RepID=A0ACC2N2Z5_9HYME|nr:hypothetical protein QAD02_007175 [Eretmocerus hayati]
MSEVYKSGLRQRTANIKSAEYGMDHIFSHEVCLIKLEMEYKAKKGKDIINTDFDQNDDTGYDGSYEDFSPQTESSPQQNKSMKQQIVRNVISRSISCIRFSEFLTVSQVCQHVNGELIGLEISIRNSDVESYFTKNYPKEFRYSKPHAANQSSIIYNSNLTIDQLMWQLTEENFLNQSSEILSRSLYYINFDLADRFCDVTDLKKAWEELQPPSPFLTFLSSFFHIKSGELSILKTDADFNKKFAYSV